MRFELACQETIMPAIALVDSNNFCVLCERVFQTKLRNRPVIVLSDHDGCIIARVVEELRGINCFPLISVLNRRKLLLARALLAANVVTIFINTNRFSDDEPQYADLVGRDIPSLPRAGELL